MSEQRYTGHKDIAGKRWTNATKGYSRREDFNPWRKTAERVSDNGSSGGPDEGASVKKFTVGVYSSKEKPSINKPEVFHMNVVRLADEVTQTVIRKQNDYGPNNIRKSPFGPLIGLTVRLYDKIARLAHLSSGKKPENESLRDTFIDIAGYGLIGLMILDGTFPDPKE